MQMLVLVEHFPAAPLRTVQEIFSVNEWREKEVGEISETVLELEKGVLYIW